MKITKTKLDFIKDEGILLLLKNNIRGGFSSVMGLRYIESDENTKLLYIDANSLYGRAKSQYFPNGDFKKIKFLENDDSIQCDEVKEEIVNTPDDNEYGYFIECEMLYPIEIKEKTENFPLCPYQTKADPNLSSDYMNSVKQLNCKRTLKLMCDLTNKQNISIRYMLFKFYIEMGMKVTKIHTIYRFKQSLC